MRRLPILLTLLVILTLTLGAVACGVGEGELTPTPTPTYVLHVQDNWSLRVPISYTGAYAGTEETPFDIGPKMSPFTVTLEATVMDTDSAMGGYRFMGWSLDWSYPTSSSKFLTVTVDDEHNERIARAVYVAYQPVPTPTLTSTPTSTRVATQYDLAVTSIGFGDGPPHSLP